ncbi:MAG: aminopeptidase P family protein [Defluviicoccus sp.]|nr:aminopeptidase P family protein [Defluviicoccus sp.]MDE0385402.1 aminopeptidase P family protein [Defluviicoccus sp.]
MAEQDRLAPDEQALLRGIVAAPEPVEPADWVRLLVDAPDAGDIALWTGRAAALRASADDGLGRSPAPPERLDSLREELRRREIDGFVVPLADEHQGEFVAPRAQRLAWLTGFTGSAGLAVVLADKAAIFVDGRYTLQVGNEVDAGRFSPLHLTEQPPGDWIAANLSGGTLGYDPWLHTLDAVARLEEACAKAGGRLAAVDDNPVDAVWADQPAPPISPAVPHPPEFAGLDSAAKRAAVAETLQESGADAAVLSAPDSIAWLFNLRGADIRNTPVALAFAVLEAAGGASLFIDRRKVTRELAAALAGAVTVAEPDGLGPALDRLAAAGRRVRVDPRTAPAWIAQRLQDARCEVVRGEDPCALPKACKNEVEVAGARAAHIRDGRALVRFLAWLDAQAPGGGVTELEAAERLFALRAEGELFRGLSFDTIAGAGPDGAIVHYRVDEASNRRLEPGSVFLVDSGGQYLDGTTDVTRTVHIRDAAGTAPATEVRDRFTRVLKGHIALARAVFPRGVTGSQLDVLARKALWEAGLDYDHGTGHGVGSFLGVHEGPARISKIASGTALAPGMILSNEPGYYKPGAYGIRIENLVVVVEAEAPDGAERPLYRFETLTLAPIDRRLVEPSLLMPDEIGWLDAYHARVEETHGPALDRGTRRWLERACAPLTRRPSPASPAR